MIRYMIFLLWTGKNKMKLHLKKDSYLYSMLTVLSFGLGRPLEAVLNFFVQPFTSAYSVGTLLNTASLFVFAACGMCFSFQTGCFNLGGEGQIYLSGFLTAVFLNRFSGVAPVILLPLVFVFVFCVTGLTGLFCAVCKIYRNINELLSSFLFSCALIPIVDFLIVDYFRDEKKSLLATPYISENFRLKSILPPSVLNFSIFLVFYVTSSKV